VVVAKTVDEAKEAVTSIMQEKVFGEAGRRVIVEECLQGKKLRSSCLRIPAKSFLGLKPGP